MPYAVPSMAALRGTVRRGGAFLAVGVLGFLVDAVVYNVLVFLGGEGPMFRAPLPAKVIAIGVATVVTYFGNRYWTFRQRPAGNVARQGLLYALFNVIAIGLQLACLGFSRYALGLDSPLADNVSGTLIGQIVAVVFRYWAYDTLVFKRESESTVAQS